MKLLAISAAASVSLLALTGCGARVASGGLPEAAPPVQAAPCTGPVRVAVLQDQTGSRGPTLTPVLTPEDLEPLVVLLRRCGGEIRVGEIRGGMPSGFAALRVEEPPAPIAEPAEWPANPFLRAEARQAFDRLRDRAAQERAAWHASTEARVAQFRSALAARWEGAQLANRTDIWAALERAELYLQEPAAGFTRPPRRWLLAVTDGQHTTARPKRQRPLDAATTLVLVNADGRLGDLAPLAPQRFESLPAAVRWIVEASCQPTTDSTLEENAHA